MRKRQNTISLKNESIPEEVPVHRCSCVIKLGGSACTQKDSFETYNFEEVSRFSEQLSDICVSESAFRPIVLHGAGSFGHFQAKQYSVGSGTRKSSGVSLNAFERISPFLREGFSKTRLSVTRLNHHILTTMIQKGIPAVGVSPFPLVPAFKRKLPSSELFGWPWESSLKRSLTELLSLGLVPVLHGDACIDVSGQATSILSGDTLFVRLCSIFRPTHAVFLADVDGVLTAPPPNGTVIKQILVNADGTWDAPMTTSTQTHDVTGGIKHKIEAAIQVVLAIGIPVYIVRAGSADAQLCIRGQRPLIGTTVEMVPNHAHM